MIVLERGETPAARPSSGPVRVVTGVGDETVGARDFGARLVQPIPAVREAAEICRVDCALADATRAFGRFADTLDETVDDPDRWPDAFSAEAARLRDAYAARLPDGPDRDRFDTAFDLFAKAKAVETREAATRRRIALNRAELDRALDAFGETAARAGHPVTAEFAAAQAESAIRRQAEAKILTEDEAAARLAAWRADAAERQVRSVLPADPDTVRTELAKRRGGIFAALPGDRRAALRTIATVYREALDRETEYRQDRSETAEIHASLARAAIFEADFAAARAAGTATALDIAAALDGGVIDAAAAGRLQDDLARDRARRRGDIDAAAAVDRRLAGGERPDPRDPDDIAAAETWFAATAGLPLSGGAGDEPDRADAAAVLAGPTGVRLVRHARSRLGFLPPSVSRRLDLFWRSGDPGLMRIAATADPDVHPDARAYLDLLAAGLDADRAAARVATFRGHRENGDTAASDGWGAPSFSAGEAFGGDRHRISDDDAFQVALAGPGGA